MGSHLIASKDNLIIISRNYPISPINIYEYVCPILLRDTLLQQLCPIQEVIIYVTAILNLLSLMPLLYLMRYGSLFSIISPTGQDLIKLFSDFHFWHQNHMF